MFFEHVDEPAPTVVFVVCIRRFGDAVSVQAQEIAGFHLNELLEVALLHRSG